MSAIPTIGVLALQGDVREHLAALTAAGGAARARGHRWGARHLGPGTANHRPGVRWPAPATGDRWGARSQAL
ncbi:hypothetical protein ABZ721_40655, partial [Streptomyces sp. NPDC006733]